MNRKILIRIGGVSNPGVYIEMFSDRIRLDNTMGLWT